MSRWKLSIAGLLLAVGMVYSWTHAAADTPSVRAVAIPNMECKAVEYGGVAFVSGFAGGLPVCTELDIQPGPHVVMNTYPVVPASGGVQSHQYIYIDTVQPSTQTSGDHSPVVRDNQGSVK